MRKHWNHNPTLSINYIRRKERKDGNLERSTLTQIDHVNRGCSKMYYTSVHMDQLWLAQQELPTLFGMFSTSTLRDPADKNSTLVPEALQSPVSPTPATPLWKLLMFLFIQNLIAWWSPSRLLSSGLSIVSQFILDGHECRQTEVFIVQHQEENDCDKQKTKMKWKRPQSNHKTPVSQIPKQHDRRWE